MEQSMILLLHIFLNVNNIFPPAFKLICIADNN